MSARNQEALNLTETALKCAELDLGTLLSCHPAFEKGCNGRLTPLEANARTSLQGEVLSLLH